MSQEIEIYCELKNKYRSKYRAIFNRVTINSEFQNGNQEKRINILRKARYDFLMLIVSDGLPEKENAAYLIPSLCFSIKEHSKVKSLEYTPDNRQYVFNPYKN